MRSALGLGGGGAGQPPPPPLLWGKLRDVLSAMEGAHMPLPRGLTPALWEAIGREVCVCVRFWAVRRRRRESSGFFVNKLGRRGGLDARTT